MEKKYIFGLSALLALVSCQDYYAEPEVTKVPQTIHSEYNIPIDSALAYLYEFMADEELSRGEGKRVVANIIPVKYNMVSSRTDEDSIGCENLLYVANFENNSGYSILAADKRISDKVIALVDEGNMFNSDIYYYAQKATASDRLILGWYPEQGDGFFTVPEADNELFINPNTVDLYIREEQDTLVGNFQIETVEGYNGNVHVLGTSSKEFSNVEYLTTSLCVSYAVNEIRRANVLGNFTTINGDAIGGDGEIGGEGHVVPTTRTEMIVSNWEVIKNTPLLLSPYENWHQGSPFNDLYPKRRKYLFFGHRVIVPAGCFPLAISKVMTCKETPSEYVYDGWNISWSELNKWLKDENKFESATGELSASYLLKNISEGCRSWYFYAGTFTFPSNVTSFMRKVGFPNAHSHYYSFERVAKMIDNGNPLIIYAMPNLNIFGSHAWNIDGYKIKERSIITCTYEGEQLIDVDTKMETYEMVHCDFGWGRKNNGYYASGVFVLNDYRVEHDDQQDKYESTKYDTWLRVITY